MLCRSAITLAVIATVLTSGCSKRAPIEEKAAIEFIQKLENSGRFKGELAWGYILESDIEHEIEQGKLDRQALIRGSTTLLQGSTAQTRWKAARLLGLFKDNAAIEPLLRALDDSDQQVRYEACWSFTRLDSNSEAVQQALIKKRREDPSPRVRVAAAFALKQMNDDEAIAALKAGLQDSYVRNLCVDKLQQLGKLKLPLPVEVYERITAEQLAEKRRFYWRSSISNEVKKDGKVYFRLNGVIDPALPVQDHWYWMMESEWDESAAKGEGK